MGMHWWSLVLTLFVPVVSCVPAAAQVLVTGTDQGVLVQAPRIADTRQLTVDSTALESVEIGPPVKDAPFSAVTTTEVIQTLADGNRIIRRTSGALHRDSRGRTRREVSLDGIAGLILPGSPLRLVTISDPESGLSYVVDSDKPLRVLRNAPDRRRAASTAPRLKPDASTSSRPRTHDLEREDALGTQNIEGVVAEGTRTTVTIPAGTIGNERDIVSVTERWFSPGLQVTVFTRQSDPRYGETTYRLTRLTRAEPPASLFEPPAR